MRLAYTADLHGNTAALAALIELAATTGARAAIVGGDLLPHAIQRETALTTQRRWIAGHLAPLLQSARAQHPQIAVYLLPGNDDWAAAIADLDALAAAGLLLLLHERVYQLADDLWLAGYGCVPPTPFSIKDYERRDDDGDLPPINFTMAYVSTGGTITAASPATFFARPTIASGLAALTQQSDPARTVYVCHAPPYDTPLDAMPRRRHVGSRALRAFITQHQPPLTLHGHIHEAPRISGQYAAQLGTTWCINPGHDGRAFHAVALDTDDIAHSIEHTVFGRPTSI